MENNKERPVREERSLTENVQEQSAVVNTFDAEGLIKTAIEQKVPVETMERLLAMRRELKAEFAKEAFDRDMAAFQAECPIIDKSKKVDFTSKRTGNRTTYSYAPLDVIISQVKPLLQKHGFSYSFDTTTANNMTTNFCKVTHELGHSETFKFEVPIDTEAFMNEQQKFGSANTFGKRYAFLNAFGILTGDEDDDSLGADGPETTAQPPQKSPKATPKQRQYIADLMTKKGYTLETLAEDGITEGTPANEVIEYLLNAPSKIGPNGNVIPLEEPPALVPDLTSPEVPVYDDSPAKAKLREKFGGKNA